MYSLFKTFALLLITLLLFNSIQATSLKKYLRPSQTFCFSQDMPKHTLFDLSLTSEYSPIRLEIMQSKSIILNQTIQQKQFNHQMTTQKFGVFKFCISNLYHTHQMMGFRFVYGVRAKDFGTHQEGQDYLRTLENQARIALMFVDQIKQENKEALTLISESSKSRGGRLSVQYFFTTVFIGIIALCTYIQYKTIRQHMISRKYI